MVNWPDSKLDARRVVDDFPKWIAFFAVLYTLPHYYWEYFCGGTLAGYLAHLKYLICVIKGKVRNFCQNFRKASEKCETVPSIATYGGKVIKDASVFDPDSRTFSTRQKYRRMWVNENFSDSDQSINQDLVWTFLIFLKIF